MCDEIVKYCKRCRKRIANRKAKWNKRIMFCSKKCANRYNGDQRRGTKQKREYQDYTRKRHKDTVKYATVLGIDHSRGIGPKLTD